MSAATKNRVAVVILAAGKGKRMGSTLPKVMHELQGKPLIEHVIEHVEEAGVCDRPYVVVAADQTLVQDHLGNRAHAVIQDQQLGTGHAVQVTEPVLRDAADHVVVLYGDMPFLTAESIQRLVEAHVSEGNTLTVMTAITPDFEEWRSVFQTFGRVVRDRAGELQRIVEWRDADQEVLKIRELSTCFFCFKADWLWSHLSALSNDNAQGEYYLVDLVQAAIDENEKVGTVEVELKEAVGINSQADFQRITLL